MANVKEYLPFLDYMKVIGLLVIVTGHLGLYLTGVLKFLHFKQLGVAFFIFVIGFSLARTKYKGFPLVFRRLFKLYFWGLLIAAVLSVIKYIQVGDLAESNYMPFLLGINTFFDYFPSNPSTWFIGTYILFIVLFAVLFHKFNIDKKLLLGVLVVEVVMRHLIMNIAFYTAYMSIFSWFAVFFFGIYFGQKKTKELKNNSLFITSGLAFTGILLFLSNFEFVRISLFNIIEFFSSVVMNQIAASLFITLIYLFSTLIIFQFSLKLKESKIVKLISKHTLFIFIVHMPIIYALQGITIDSFMLKKLFLFTMAFIVPLIASMILTKILKVDKFGAYLWSKISRKSS